MAGQNTGFQMSYRIDATNINPDTGKNEVPRYRIVQKVGDNTIKLADANAVPLGVTANDERLDDPLRDGGSQAGRQIAVQLDRIANVELASAVNANDPIVAAAGGKGQAIPETPGTYNVLGFAEKGGDAGDVVPVRIAYHVRTV